MAIVKSKTSTSRVAFMMAISTIISVTTAFQPSTVVVGHHPLSFSSSPPANAFQRTLIPLRTSLLSSSSSSSLSAINRQQQQQQQQQPLMQTALSDLLDIPVQPLQRIATADSSSSRYDDDDDDGDAVTTFQNTIPLGDILQLHSSPLILSCLTHFGDFNAWELTQQYMAAIDSGKLKRPIVLVGIGSVESAQKFSDDLELRKKYRDRITLVADETGAVTEALGCYKGWLTLDQLHANRWQQTRLNPYLRLLGMIFGFGSPGTIPQVLYGYAGDIMDSNGSFGRQWVVDALLQGSDKGRFPVLTEEAFDDVPSDSKLRPFELATLRLQTGLHIVAHWAMLGPKNGDLFTRMGGTFVFDTNGNCTWHHYDTGILAYTNVKNVCDLLVDVEDRHRDGNDDELFVVELETNQRAELQPEAEELAKKETRVLEDEVATTIAAVAGGTRKAEKATRQAEEEAVLAAAEESARQAYLSQRSLLAARLQREAKEQVEQEKRVQAEEKEAIEIAAGKEAAVHAEVEETTRQAYLSQRSLLAARLQREAKEVVEHEERIQAEEKEAIEIAAGKETAVLTEVEETTRQAYLSQRSLLAARLQREAKEQVEHEERIQAEEEEAEIAAMEEEYREAEEAIRRAEEEVRLTAAEEVTRQAYRSQRSLLETRLQHMAIEDAAGRKIANKVASSYLGALEEASMNKKAIIPASSYLNMLRQAELFIEDEQSQTFEKALAKAAEIAAAERTQADEKAAIEAAEMAAADETNRKAEEARQKVEEQEAKENKHTSAASEEEQSAATRKKSHKSISSFLDELNEEFSQKKLPRIRIE